MSKLFKPAALTSQEAANKVGNLFDLVLIAANRTRDLNSGHRSHVNTLNSNPVQALMEIEQGHVGREYLKRLPDPVRKSRSHHRTKYET